MSVTVMKRALDFIDSVKVHPSQIASRDALHDTLFTAIEQAQKQEPVAVPPDYVPLSDDRMRVFIDGVGEVPLAWPSTPPAAQQEPTDLELYQCWIDKPDGTIDGIASMRLALKKYGGRPAQPIPAQPTTATQTAAPQQCWACGDMDAAFQGKCTVATCEMKERP